MKVVAVATLKARLSHYLQRLSRGDPIFITEHNTPVARLMPLSWKQDHAELLEVLEVTGVVSRPTKPRPARAVKREARG